MIPLKLIGTVEAENGCSEDSKAMQMGELG